MVSWILEAWEEEEAGEAVCGSDDEECESGEDGALVAAPSSSSGTIYGTTTQFLSWFYTMYNFHLYIVLVASWLASIGCFRASPYDGKKW